MSIYKRIMKSAPDKRIKGNEEHLFDKSDSPPYDLYDMPYREVINEIAKSYPYCIYFFLWRVYCNDKDRKFTFPYNISATEWNKFQTKLNNIKVGKETYSLLIPVKYEKDYHSHPNIASESNLDKDGPKIFKSLERYGFWKLILQIPKEILRNPEAYNTYFVRNFKLFPPSSHKNANVRESKSVISSKKRAVKEDNNNYELRISTTKTKATYPLTVKCGFCKKEHEYYVEKRHADEIGPKDTGFITREENNRKLRFLIDFHNWDFDIRDENQDINQFSVQDLLEGGINTRMVLTNVNSKEYLHYKSISKPKKAKETRITRNKTQPLHTSKSAITITQTPRKILVQKTEDSIFGFHPSKNINVTHSEKFREKLWILQEEEKKREEREKKLNEKEKRLKNKRFQEKMIEINKQKQKRFKKIKKIYRNALLEELKDCLVHNHKKLMRDKVRERLIQTFSSFLEAYQYHEDDYTNYMLEFKKYWKEHLSKDLKKYTNFLKKVNKNKRIPDSVEDSIEISEKKAENFEDSSPNENCSGLRRCIKIIRYFLFLTIVFLYFYILILGFQVINNAPFPPSAAANSFKDICFVLYVIFCVLLTYLIFKNI